MIGLILIILMEALVANSRSIGNDQFLERQQKLKHDRHIKKVD